MAARGIARLAAELTGSTSPGARPQAWVEPAVLKAIATGYLQTPTITVTWRDTDVPASYLDSYTPKVDDVVLLLIQPPSLVVLGKLNGPNLESD